MKKRFLLGPFLLLMKLKNSWYNHQDPHSVFDVVRGNKKEYSLLPEYYLALCKRHHEDFDMEYRKGLETHNV
jgi:hypothetical protein